MSSQNRASLLTVVVALVIGALIALAGSQHGATVAGLPVFALAVAIAFLVQIVVYIPSAIARTERFFDLTGSLTFIAVSVLVLVAVPAPDLRSWVLAAMVILWAVRLGSFLFLRIRRSGADDRFDELKARPLPFLRVWVLQGLWVSVTASAAWIAMSVAPEQRAPLGWLSIVGVVVWVVGITIEVVADAQKSAFRADAAGRGRFIRTGLWSRSRHPNYFGEILLWIGVMLVAAPVLTGWQWVALLSPVFVILLLTRVSGIPLLEAKADRTWGGDADYEAYKAATPVLIPRLTAPAA
ncbi:DUF1295 domain-containing protein [Microbacterium sp. W1N]|uniref:DUF1295 domain-containing protein n=1 Tax=Microbacterium festucae TaxID=2977531 RepID=UPI0021BEED04|nr:DUF1295 domain-containing protein [Microbacterium festucae]MCT9821446.1 DUF1295 domain-containing protein [Microbacterium festucae]